MARSCRISLAALHNAFASDSWLAVFLSGTVNSSFPCVFQRFQVHSLTAKRSERSILLIRVLQYPDDMAQHVGCGGESNSCVIRVVPLVLIVALEATGYLEH
jgi:hypothetical protein